jgi:hypothetical protein
MLMHEWHHVRDGSINSTVMVFELSLQLPS